MKGLAVLGSSGTVGSYVLDAARKNPDKFKIISLCVNNNIQKLISSAWEFRPKFVGFSDPKVDYSYIKEQLPENTQICIGEKALEEAVNVDGVDVVAAVSAGTASLRAVLLAVSLGKKIALANKEVLVSGGSLLINACKNGQIIPVDSEHSAVFQCLNGESKKNLKRIILTASGGAFFGRNKSELEDITPELALKHPNWNMGKKITIDSATMMNKGLEIIEAKYLFQTDNVDYVIHPSSTVHSMVEFVDNSVIAQLGNPSMEIPVLFALSYPDRLNTSVRPLNFFDLHLDFYQPDEDNFPFPKLARQVYQKGGLTLAVMIAADEKAVELFLNKKIGFLDIYRLVDYCVTKLSYNDTITVDNIIKVDNEVREYLNLDYNKILK
ncbi:MAG TPA: 1-deoxy-D-xylulose-5-phosphate reductoisomerase [Clostridia bacterium]